MKRQPASAERKSHSPKEDWGALRRRYTWHLRPPFTGSFDCSYWWNLRSDFTDRFDRSHWWKKESEIEPAAALYELARRHPLVGEGLLRRFPPQELRASILAEYPHRPPDGIIEGRLAALARQAVAQAKEPPSLYWTCCLGLKSWATLDYTERLHWEFSVGHVKGFDFRLKDVLCHSINLLADWKIRDEREATLSDRVRGKDRREEVGKIVNADLAAHPPTTQEWEAAIAQRAVEAHRAGSLLFAFAPDLPAKKAALLIKEHYGLARRLYGKPKQRPRWQDWLPLIAAFEDEETRRDTNFKSCSQTFAHYRRALDGIRFT